MENGGTNLVVHLTTEELERVIGRVVRSELAGSEEPDRNSEARQWLSRAETADLLHVSFPTLRRYEKEKILVPTRLGRRVLYAREDVEARLAEGYSVNQRRKTG